MTRLLSTTDAAAVLGMKPSSLRARRARAQGPPYIRLGPGPSSRVAYAEDDLQRWLAARPRYTGTKQEKAALRPEYQRTARSSRLGASSRSVRRGGGASS